MRRSLSRSGRKKSRRTYIMLGIVSLSSIFPFLWLILTSLKTQQQIFDVKEFIPTSISFANFYNVLVKANFLMYFKNSLIVATVSTVICMLLSITCAYGMTRFRLFGWRQVKMSILYTRMFPGILLALPYYVIIRNLHLSDSLAGLIFIYCSFTLPFCIWNMQAYFEKLPWELEEAAYIDGANRITAFFSVMMPIARPGITATALFAFMMSWDEFMFANLFITSTTKKTISLGMQSFVGEYSTDWGSLMAAATISLIPIIIFFAFAQKNLVGGLASGGVKG